MEDVAKFHDVGVASLNRWLRLLRETGSLEPRPNTGGRRKGISEEGEQLLRRHLKLHPDDSLGELVKILNKELKIKTSESTVSRTLARIGITRKKTFHAQERDTERVENLRAEYWKYVQDIDTKSFVFIDEASAKLSMSLLYGWGEKGDRVPGTSPSNWKENITMIGALTLDGVLCMMTVNGGTTGEVFSAFVEQLLVQRLGEGDVVVLDNLSAHKVNGISELIEKTGAEVLFLPPYSPDLNPIEQCWSKLKHLLRKAGARTLDALDNALGEAMKCVSTSDSIGWFSECGYI